LPSRTRFTLPEKFFFFGRRRRRSRRPLALDKPEGSSPSRRGRDERRPPAGHGKGRSTRGRAPAPPAAATGRGQPPPKNRAGGRTESVTNPATGAKRDKPSFNIPTAAYPRPHEPAGGTEPTPARRPANPKPERRLSGPHFAVPRDPFFPPQAAGRPRFLTERPPPFKPDERRPRQHGRSRSRRQKWGEGLTCRAKHICRPSFCRRLLAPTGRCVTSAVHRTK
jgi:hypothetical protein